MQQSFVMSYIYIVGWGGRDGYWIVLSLYNPFMSLPHTHTRMIYNREVTNISRLDFAR